MRWLNCVLLVSSAAAPIVSGKLHGAPRRRAETATSKVYPSSTLAYQPTDSPMFQLSSDSQFAFYLEEVMGLANNGGASSGEVLRIARNIVPHDLESTYTAFNYMAEHIYAIAESIDITKDPVSARDAYLRAATYYRGADFFLIGNQSDPRNYILWDKALESFDNAMALMKPVPGERFTVKAHSPNVGDFEAIGIFYKASTDNEPRPTILIGNGYDGSQEESYHSVARDVLARGLNAVTYEGPGQPTVRRKQDLGFIPDWWNVVEPIVDYLSNRSDVDMSKLALTGISFGGSLAPIAASHENRFSAVLAIDGLISLRDEFVLKFPSFITELYDSGNKTAFDETLLSIAANVTIPTSLRWAIDQSLWAFNTDSPYDWWTRFGQFNVTKQMIQNLPMPIFVAKGQDDTTTNPQPDIAYKAYISERPNGKQLTHFHEFQTSLGAGEHCAIGAESHQNQVTLEWLSGIWGGYAFENNPIGI